MRARLLLSSGSETVACSHCDGGGNIGAPSRFPTFFVFFMGNLEAIFGAPYRLLSPTFGAMDVIGRCWRELYSLSVVGGRFYFDAAGVISSVRCQLIFLRRSLMGDLTAPLAAGLVLTWLCRVPTMLLLRRTCLYRVAMDFSSTQFVGAFTAPPAG